MNDQQGGYYTSRKRSLLRDLDKTVGFVKDALVSRYGGEFADQFCSEVRQEYEVLVPQIPHIDNQMAVLLNVFLVISAQELAVYKVMKRHGKTAGEAWEICHEALRSKMDKIPRIKRWVMKRLVSSSLVKRRMQKRAAQNQQHRFGDFEVRYVMGDGKDCDFGVDYLKCGIYKFMQDHEAEEFAPYVCMSDIALSDAFEWGLTRTETLADGCDKCDFRFKKGGKTQISSRTAEVQATIERIRRREAS